VSSGALRVLMTADAVGGVFTYALDLCRVLGDRGVEVVLATMGPRPSDAQREKVAALPSVTLVESDYALEWMDHPWQDVARAGKWLLELERRHRPDVVHLNGYVHGDLPFRAPVLMVAHSCVLSWWQAVKGESVPERYGLYRERVREGLFAADLVVAPSCAMLSALHRHYGHPSRSVIIANGCDTDAFVPREKQPFIAAAGRLWDEAKNLTLLARAAGKLRWPVRIAGSAAHPSGGDVALASDAVLLGQLSRSALRELLGEASIYAFPARYEPFGLSVLEAAASGAALVLGDIPSLRELWDGAARFVPPDDEAALIAETHALIDDAEARVQLAKRARLRAQRFGLDLFGHSYAELYRELVALRRARAERAVRPFTPARSAS